MSNLQKPLMVFMLLFIISAGGWFLINPFNGIKLENDSTKPSLILYDLTLKEFGKNGKLEKKLTTPKLVNFKNKDTSILTSPTITLLRENIPWTITAKRAHSYDDNQKILLQGHVMIKQQPHNKLPTTINTERLWYYPQIQIAKTSDPVTFKQLGVLIKSKGMRVNLKNEQLELLHHARGKYEPTHG